MDESDYRRMEADMGDDRRSWGRRDRVEAPPAEEPEIEELPKEPEIEDLPEVENKPRIGRPPKNEL